MHETGIVRDLVRRLVTLAQENGAASVSGVDIRLGALGEFSPEHFRAHFEAEARGTLAEAAALRLSVCDDWSRPDALDVTILSVDLDFPDGPGEPA